MTRAASRQPASTRGASCARAALLSLAACLAACSSSPASPNLSTSASSIEKEGRFDCQVTRQRMTALANSMSGLHASAKVQAQQLPSTALATIKRLTGPRGSGVPAVEQFEAEKVRYDALAAAAKSNNCPTGDVEKTYADAIEKMAPYRAGQ